MNRQERMKQDGLTEEPVEFYGKNCEFNCFSNFSPHTVTLPSPWTGKPVVYPTGEHRYQAMKADYDESHDWVVESSSPGESKERGRQIDLRKEWDEILGYYVMLEIVTHKATQHLEVMEMLYRTENRTIWEDSPIDDIWGIRFRNDYRGKNLLGKSWMQAREVFYDGTGALLQIAGHDG